MNPLIIAGIIAGLLGISIAAPVTITCVKGYREERQLIEAAKKQNIGYLNPTLPTVNGDAIEPIIISPEMITVPVVPTQTVPTSIAPDEPDACRDSWPDDLKDLFTKNSSPVGDRSKWPKWLRVLLNYQALLIFGGFGSGKTTLAMFIIEQRKKMGHQVVVLDPHHEQGDWPGSEVIGPGMDYQAIDSFINKIVQVVKSRYEQRAQQRGLRFEPLTIVTEELTNWADNCSQVETLIKKIPDYRKINVHLLMVAHGETLGSLGGTKGNRDVLDNTLVKIQLMTKAGEDVGAEPQQVGLLRFPKSPVQQVIVPDIDIEEPPPQLPPSEREEPTVENIRDSLERLYKSSGEGSQVRRPPSGPVRAEPPEPCEPVRAEPPEPFTGNGYSDPLSSQSPSSEPVNEPEFEPQEEVYTYLKLNLKQAVELVRNLRGTMKQTQIIETYWRCSKGGGKTFVNAHRQYLHIIDVLNNKLDWEA